MGGDEESVRVMTHSIKRLCLLGLLAFFVCLWADAQNIAVKSFRLLETDLTANLKETQEIDQNGEVAALIKVITTETGFLFDVGALGIVRQVQQPGEIWLYVPHGVQRISINHQKLGRPEQPYYFSIPIQAARTYELVLTASRVKTIVEEDAGGAFLELTVTPPTATVYVDDNIQALDSEGTLSVFLLYGEHTYRVEAPGYRPETGKVEIVTEATKSVTVALQEQQKASITFTTSMADAEIWVNNRQQGIGQWTGGMSAGTYIVETRKAGHRSQRTTVTVSDGDGERTVTLEAPVPMVGRLRVESRPSGADVFLGGTNLGRTPGIFNDVLVGTHTLTFRKEGYADQTAEVMVEEGKVVPVSATLESLGGTPVADTPKPNPQKEPKPKADERPATPKREAKPSLFAPLSLYGSADFQVGAPLAFGASLGGYLKGFNVEASFGVPFGEMDSSGGVSWTLVDDYGFPEEVFYQYYKASLFINGHIGYGIPVARFLRLTPRVGFSSLSVASVYSTREQKTFIFSAVASLRTEIAFSRSVGMFLTPQYNLPVRRGQIAEAIYEAPSSDTRLWNNGFYLTVGLYVNLFSIK